MSSLARRTFRTTAAVAGIAALGVGISGPAFGVELPGLVEADVTEAPSLPSGSVDQLVSGISETSVGHDVALPELFSFEAPSFTTTAPNTEAEASETAATDEAAVEDSEASETTEATEEASDDETAVEESSADEPAEASALPSVPALPALDSAQLPADLTLPLPQGNSVELDLP